MSLKNTLSNSINEKDVENIYRAELIKSIDKAQITSPYSVDGLLEATNIRTLLEFKYQEPLKNKISHCNVLIQCLYYLKKFELAGDKLPSTIFVGDINECFALHTNNIIKYLSSEIDWKIAPSEAYKKNPDLIQAMVSDNDILPFIFDIDDKFQIRTIIEKIKELSDNVIRKVRVTQHNITSIFDYFDKNVLGEKVKLNTNEKANLFIQLVINPNENYIHPKKKNILSTKSFGELAINSNLFNSFFQHFEGQIYSPKEKEDLTKIQDRIIEDTTRRKKGEFFTPTPFVDLAHKYISDTFGEDWKDRFVVWDCAWGTGNLTRDYKFNELYVSTLEQSDIDTANQMGYNPEAVKFKFDFLNDSDNKLPVGLQNAIENGREILFLINPPYATANNMGTEMGDHKAGVGKTIQNELMLNDGWGKSSQNLYAQFLYRIYKYQKLNRNIKIGLFSPPLFLSGNSYVDFRKNFNTEFGFESGFLFEASYFSDVANGWGISFTIFDGNINLKKYVLDIVEYDNSFSLCVVDKKEIYNTDNEISASEWVRKEIRGLKTFDAPQISSATIIKEKGIGNISENALGYMLVGGNNVMKNNQNVALFSSAFSNGHGLSIIEENYFKCINIYTSRRLITGQYANWKNWNDEYLAPNEQHSNYKQFTYDSIIYSLFDSKANQSSLRQIDYKNKKWDIKNEFFWLSKNEMQALANENSYDELYKDAKNGDERYVYKKLFQEGIYEKLSPEAKEVLDIATDLLKKSIKARKLVSEEHPEYHLNSFDAGWAQLKLITKEYFKEEHKMFREKYAVLEKMLRPQIFTLGFLRK